ncbi:hypothetical protein HG530_009480 [Fusarium avenaceum]|nr:hypothetical protein HG530_009480 [Fusarium avenaceum]
MRTSDRLRLGRVVRVRTKNNTQNRIILSKSIVKSLDNNSGNTLTATVAISAIIESLAVSSPRKKVPTIKTSMEVRVSENIGTASNRRVNVALPEGVAGEMDTSQTG